MRERRAFLQGLATLPLIGGGVALIGKPTAAAVPVTEGLLDSYETWLALERNRLRFERYGDLEGGPLTYWEVVFQNRRTGDVMDCIAMGNDGSRHMTRWPKASTRAAVILSAAGVSLTGGRANG